MYEASTNVYRAWHLAKLSDGGLIKKAPSISLGLLGTLCLAKEHAMLWFLAESRSTFLAAAFRDTIFWQHL